MNVPTLRPLSFGEILDGGFSLYRRNFVTFVLTTLVMAVAMIAVAVVLGGAAAAGMGDINEMGEFFGALFGVLLLMGIGFGVVASVLAAALTREASQAYTGQPTSLGDGLSTGARKGLRVFASGVVAFLMMMVAGLAIGIVMGIVQVVIDSMGIGLLTLLAQLIYVLLVVALYLLTLAIFFAVVPAVVVEGKGPVEAIGRSFDLVRGAPVHVVGVMMVTFFIAYLPMLAVLLLTGGLTALVDRDAVPTIAQFITQQILALGVGILTTPFVVSVMVLLYYDRRVRTEALDVQMLTDRLAVL